MKTTSRKDRRTFTARLDPPAFEWVRLNAFRNYRSMNAELNILVSKLMNEEEASGHVAKQSPDASEQ